MARYRSYARCKAPRMNIQLWSYNYDPEPTGIGPVSTVWARGMTALGHKVDVVAAHPHYPEPRWGTRVRPYRELRGGVSVLRLPLWIGRDSTLERYRQELSFMTAQALVTPLLDRPDVRVVVSPSFPALAPAVIASGLYRVPWVLWLHDILPDGAASSGLVRESSSVIRLSRRLERAAYRSADRVVVISPAFTTNLVAKGVPEGKIQLIYLPATRVPRSDSPSSEVLRDGSLRVLSMGNIGFSQGLAELIGAFENETQRTADVRIVITGHGMDADATRAQLRTGRVEMLGVVDDDRLEAELLGADVALVTQKHRGTEFNIPSKLMNFMAYGLPVIAAVNPGGEVARLVTESGAGWVVDSGDAGSLPRAMAEIAADRDDVAVRASAARAYAEAHFTQRGFAQRFAATLREVLAIA